MVNTKTETVTHTEQDKSDHVSPFLVFKGFIMGAADIIPGVSGGTMALILGIYSRLIHAISSFDLIFLKKFFTLRWREAFKNVDWKFLTLLMSGILCAVLFFTKIVPLQVYMFTDPELIYGLFFGLILGSIYILVKELESFNWIEFLLLIIGTFIGFWVVTRLPAATPTAGWFVFLSGSLAVSAMILPGISGSYILLILRKYDFILTQLGKLGTSETFEAIWILLPFILGMIIGLALFTRLLRWLLDRYYTQTLVVLIGFLIGSLYMIWPYQQRTYTQFVSESKVVTYQAPEAETLRNNPPNTQLPEFNRLGDVITSGNVKKVEIETVEQKFVSAEPYIPYVTVEGTKTNYFWMGILGMAIGVCLVWGIDYLRQKQ